MLFIVYLIENRKMGIKSIFPILILAAVTVSCESKNPEREESDKAEIGKADSIDSAAYKTVDLTEFNIQRDILIPKKDSEKVKIQQSPVGTIEINMDGTNAVEIVPNPPSIEQKKEELELDPIFTITYIEENPAYLFYSKEIENSGIAPEYHFYILLDDKNGKVAVKTQDMLQLNKEKAEKLFNSFRSQLREPS